MSTKHVDHQLELRGGKYPLPELLVLTVTKPVEEFTTFENLMVREALDAISRIRRQG